MSEDGSNRLYIGTDNKRIYVMDDATDLMSVWQDVTLTSMPSAHIDCIAVDPLDSEKAMAVFTNYGVYSLYYTEDAGANWEKAAGNLEQNSAGAGNGPSCRWATIHRWHPDSVVYYVGTSVGLFSTSLIEDINTEWQHESPEEIGNTVVSHLVSRSVDRSVFAGTHGAGVYQSSVSQLSLPSSIAEVELPELQIWPNPAVDYIQVDLSNVPAGIWMLTVLDTEGSEVIRSSARAGQQPIIRLGSISEGMYFLLLRQNNIQRAYPFMRTQR
jgi:hypothetical protein